MEVFFIKLFASCHAQSVLGIPTWYKNLPHASLTVGGESGGVPVCRPAFSIDDLTREMVVSIITALIEAAAYIAGIVAVFIIVYGGFRLITSAGNQQSVESGRKTVTNGIIGLIIAVSATAIVNIVNSLFGANYGEGSTIQLPTSGPDTSFDFASLLNTIIIIIGALSVLFVAIGGFRYVISNGEPANTKKATETIIYAIVGLIISVFSFVIVNFILQNVNPGENSDGLVGENGVITQATRLVVQAVGAVSVIMIIVGGIRMVMFGSDPNNLKASRSIVLYAVIGLIVAIAAQAIVTFVLQRI